VITVRVLGVDEVDRIREIDRAETIRIGYRQEGTELVETPVRWDDPGWREGDGEHSFGRMIRGAEDLMEVEGTAFGAFDGDRLVGIAIYRPRLTEAVGQLGLLHVSAGYRRRGIASRLFREVLALARSDGAECLYVSATPSGSAVGFYLHHGFVPTADPDPQLLREEPDDIHMIVHL